MTADNKKAKLQLLVPAFTHTASRLNIPIASKQSTPCLLLELEQQAGIWLYFSQ